MGAIPKSAVKKFIARDRDDFREYKKLKYRQLKKLKDDLPIKPPIWKKLWKHQRACFLIGVKCKKFFYNLDTGCGKTLLSISLVRYFRKAHKTRPFMIIVPNRVNLYEWESEIRIHSPKSKCLLLDKTVAENWENLQKFNGSFCVITWGALRYLVCGKRESKKKSGNEMVISDKHIRWLLKCLSGLIVDESTVSGGSASLDTRIVRRLSRVLEYVFLLTGTPFGKNPELLWSQMFLVDRGHSLGESLGLFRKAFFSEVPNPFSAFPDYVFNRSKKKLLHNFIAHRSIRYGATGLPACVEVLKHVKIPKEAYPHFDQAEKEFKEALRGQGLDSLQRIQSSFVRLRQISSGYVGFKDTAESSKVYFEFVENPKLEMLLSLLHDIIPSHKAIVFFDYVYTGKMLSNALKKQKIQHYLIQGGTKQQKEKLNSFKNDDNCRVLLLNNFCGGFGLNLQIAKYGIYFESPLSPITRLQTRRRFERQGSKHSTVFLYDLIMKGTKDVDILESLKEGVDLFEAIIEGKSS